MKRATHTNSKMPGKAVTRRKCRSYIFYGKSGTGKTTLAASFPKPLLLLDIRDEGTDSVDDIEDIECRELESFEEFESMYWWIKKNYAKFATVVVDTCSQVQSILIKEYHDDASKKGSAGDWGSMSKRDWADVSAQLKDIFGNYRDLTQLGINVVFIAQDRVFNVDDGSEIDGEIDPEVGPQLMPSVAKALNASVSVIGNTFIRNVEKVKKGQPKKEVIKYGLRVGPSPAYITKIRKPKSIVLPGAIYDPDYDKIIEIIKGVE